MYLYSYYDVSMYARATKARKKLSQSYKIRDFHDCTSHFVLRTAEREIREAVGSKPTIIGASEKQYLAYKDWQLHRF